ncbi:MAG: hypothetical protein JW715_07340 [Sedimentisphaerales bacterium]|nr:hypothetical protein [Sedimentisphaerales bacterium]
MRKKAKYIGIIILVAVFAILLLYTNQSTGFIKIDTPGFETDLVIRNRKTSLFGRKPISLSGNGPFEIKVGSYMPRRIVLRKTETSDKWYSLVSNGKWGDLGAIDVSKGQTTEIRLGPPLKIKTEIRHSTRNETISVSIVGRAGEQWNPQVLTPEGPKTAKLKVINETGDVLAEGRCQYG